MREISDVFLLRKALQQTFSTGWSVCCTQPFVLPNLPLEGQIRVHIAIPKSTSKNLC